MSLALIVYLAGVISNLQGISVFGLFVSTVACIVSAIFKFAHGGDTSTYVLKRAAIALTVFVFLVVFTPSEKTMYIMAGAYATQKVAENPEVQRMSGKVFTIIEQKLDDLIEKGQKKAEKAVK